MGDRMTNREAEAEQADVRRTVYTKPDGTAYLSDTEWEYRDAVSESRNFGRPAGPAIPAHPDSKSESGGP